MSEKQSIAPISVGEIAVIISSIVQCTYPNLALIAAAGCNGTVDSIDLFSEESYFLDANSTTLEIEFSTETPWEAAVAYFGYEEDWLSLDSRTGDAGSSVISVYVEPNYSGYSRKAAVTIADEDGATLSVSIEQSSEYGGGELEPDEPSVGRDGFVRSVRVNYNDEEEMMYSFGYNETGRLSDIEISFDGEGVSESYSIYWDSYPIQVRYGYDGSSIFIYDIESDGIAERIEAESEPGYVDYRAEIEYAGRRLHAIKAEYAKYYNNLMMNEKRLAELDVNDRHYDRRMDSLNRVMDDLYEKIDDAQSRLDDIDNEIAMAEKSTMTKQSIFEMLEGFSKYYDIMTPEDKKALLQAMISYIELYKEKREDRHLVKAIHFTFPVTFDGESGALFVRTKEQQVEICTLEGTYLHFTVLLNGCGDRAQFRR